MSEGVLFQLAGRRGKKVESEKKQRLEKTHQNSSENRSIKGEVS